MYWGQGYATELNEKNLGFYCQDDTVQVVMLSFLYIFPAAATLKMDFRACKTLCNDPTYPEMICCPSVATDIATCQSRGKKVILSLGGATGVYSLSSPSAATSFATLMWNMFLGGSGVVRPFGTVKLDGIDLDLEAGNPSYFADFNNHLRTLFLTDTSKKYYIAAAPQCIYPDASLGIFFLSFIPFSFLFLYFVCVCICD